MICHAIILLCTTIAYRGITSSTSIGSHISLIISYAENVKGHAIGTCEDVIEKLDLWWTASVASEDTGTASLNKTCLIVLVDLRD